MTPSDLEAVFEVRLATRENRVTLQELAEDYGITLEGLAEGMRSHVRGWLAQDGPRVAGFSMGDASNGEVQVVAIHPDYEGRGLGRTLLARVTDWLFSEGHAEVWLFANRDPTLRASGFYRKLGWQPTGTVKGDEEILRLIPSFRSESDPT
ncbi:GNAT family N-acetyltransferase [Algihabitans albus]|uniref:GNAT family N-acetyltransferase n=1 Tax=Algihabitans albus TaxID=2164067 RepID=UPI000E5D049E|nr:GNAT family N-acetyltransferase [Algihabitans albus]